MSRGDLEADVAVVGAGLAGLQCARTLREGGLEVVVLESAERVGGRVRSDHVDGFVVDRGFQLLNPAYPAVRRWVDVEALGMQAFEAGVAVREDTGLRVLGDPRRAPRLLPGTLRAVAGQPQGLWAVARWAAPVLRPRRRPLGDVLSARPDVTLAEALDSAGVDGRMRCVLDAFYAGVVLEDRGETSNTFALLLAWMFLRAAPGLPARGMQALPDQLAAGWGDRLRTGTRVEEIAPGEDRVVLTTSSGPVRVRRAVVATGPRDAGRLAGVPVVRTKGVVTHWFATQEPPTPRAMLFVDGRDTRGPLVNAAVVSHAAASYAPPGRCLVEASALLSESGVAPSEAAMRAHAGELFGCSAESWETVARHEIPEALPAQPAPFDPARPVDLAPGVLICGDHRDTASIQGALVSGHRAAVSLRDQLL